jgi:DNA-binding response OmpR family regulator
VPAASAPRQILVIDDDQGVRRLVSRALQAEGMEVDQAADGGDGLRKALAGRYDAVMLDLTLPKLNGMAVLRALLSAKPREFVIVTSCRTDPRSRSDCARAGARAFLDKPFTLGELVAAVAASTEGSGRERAQQVCIGTVRQIGRRLYRLGPNPP